MEVAQDREPEVRGVRGGEAERSGARKRRRRGRRRRTRRTSGGVDCRSNGESFSPSRLWPPAAFEEFDPHRGSNASRVMPSQVSLRKSSSRGSSSADGTVAHFFFQIERGVMTKSSKEKREKMRGPLNTLLLPLDTSQLAHFRAFFFAMSFVMTSLSAALPMRASSRAGEFCYSMRSANEPARGARSEKAESRIWWPSSPSPSPSIKSFLFLFASPSRRELATARRLSGSVRARFDLCWRCRNGSLLLERERPRERALVARRPCGNFGRPAAAAAVVVEIKKRLSDVEIDVELVTSARHGARSLVCFTKLAARGCE